MPGYRHRIAFGTWINDMRNEPLPLEQWPAPQLDDTTVQGIIDTLDVISEAGYGYLDAFGLYATTNYPLDIVSAFDDPERARQVERVFSAADKRGIKMVLCLGVHTWGYDRIIVEDPSVRGVDEDGNPHPHAMCGAKEKSWDYIELLIETMFSRHDFGAVHLESADLGYCMCPECAGGLGSVGYNARLNTRAAQIIKAGHPDVLAYVCPINWSPWELAKDGKQRTFDGEALQHVIELSRHIDVFMDQGHHGRFIAWDDVPRLHCDYGTSGGLWLYHGCRQDRLSYLVPYVSRMAGHIKDHYEHGARAALLYQGPMANPGVRVNSACGGRLLQDPSREPAEVLSEVIAAAWKPRSDNALRRLTQLFLDVEEGYFGRWDPSRIQGTEPPGELMLGSLFNTSPDAATHLMEPYLDTEGRAACHAAWRRALGEAIALREQFEDRAALDGIIRALNVSLQLLATIRMVKGEKWLD